MEFKSKKQITIQHTLELSGLDLIKAINTANQWTDGFKHTQAIPTDGSACAEFDIPGSGNYSNTQLDFTDEKRVVISWETKS